MRYMGSAGRNGPDGVFGRHTFEISVRTVLPCTSVHQRNLFTRFKQGRKLLEVCGSVGGNDICHRLHRIFSTDTHLLSVLFLKVHGQIVPEYGVVYVASL